MFHSVEWIVYILKLWVLLIKLTFHTVDLFNTLRYKSQGQSEAQISASPCFKGKLKEHRVYFLSAVVSMRKAPHRLRQLNSQSPGGSTVCGGLVGWLSGRSVYLGHGSESTYPSPLSICSLCFHVVENVISLLPALAPGLPAAMLLCHDRLLFLFRWTLPLIGCLGRDAYGQQQRST